MLEYVWGLKTHAMLDVWSIEHVFSGLSIGHIIRNLNSRIFLSTPSIRHIPAAIRYFDLIGVLFLAYLWESIEHYLETGIAGENVEFWFQGVEYWPNRIIFDPLMLVLGYLIARSMPNLVTPARVGSMAWLITHIAVFPHSMYLHDGLWFAK